jgi:hypothetical protein
MTAKTVKALPGRVLVSNIKRGERKIGSIILANDNGTSAGIRARWAEVFDVGAGVDDIRVGEWILVNHGRWTRAVKVNPNTPDEFQVWQVDYPDGVLAVSDTPTETYAGESVIKSEKLQR